MLMILSLLVLLGVLLGVARSRALRRADSRYALATAHRHLPELMVLVPMAILATLALMLLLHSYRLTWYLPVVVDRWRELILWTLSSGTFSYLAGISNHISFARREPERFKLLLSSIGILVAVGYMQMHAAWPVARQLGHHQTPDGYVLQTSAYSCAAASLANVARYHGIPATEKHMAQLAGTSRSGTSAGQILHALRKIGLRGIKRQATITDLTTIKNPCILLVEFPGFGPDSHAIVLLPSAGKTLRIIDPLSGLERRPADFLALIWHGHLIECLAETSGQTGDAGRTRTAAASSPAASIACEPPAPPLLVSTQANFTFFICGDNRGGDEIYLQILAAANNRRAAFLISTGDLVPFASDAHWAHFEDLMTHCRVPFFPVAGNHDVRGDRMEPFERWTPTHTAHYSFDYGQLHFTMANDSHDMTASELAWLDADLQATRQPVKIVAHHHPAWNPSGPVYGMTQNREEFLAVLQKHGVRYDFCGHDHGYRTGITNGTTLVVSGGAGAPLYHEAEEGGFNHYVEFTVKGTNVVFQAVPISQ